MTSTGSKPPTWRRFLTIWGVTSAIVPFVIFLILGIFTLDLNTKLWFTGVAVIVWCLLLAPFYIMDWDEKRRERYKELCKGDALVKLWRISLDIAEDGSCEVERTIVAVNLADQRQYYELESWTDPEKDSSHESFLKETRKIKPEVTIARKGQSEEKLEAKTFEPDIAQRINQIIHVIPLVKNGEPLKPWDKFTIKYKEKTEMNIFSIKGDYYQHRIRHITDRLEVEILLPKGWGFPKKIKGTEKLAVGEEKSPTMGEWVPTSEKPKISTEKGRTRIVWAVDETRLLHIYKLSYHALDKLRQ